MAAKQTQTKKGRIHYDISGSGFHSGKKRDNRKNRKKNRENMRYLKDFYGKNTKNIDFE